ncbi:hypothetical protein D3C85_1341170 [compost metagenome]
MRLQWLFQRLDQLDQRLLQRAFQLAGVFEALQRYPLTHVAQQVAGGIHAHVRSQQHRFQFFV